MWLCEGEGEVPVHRKFDATDHSQIPCPKEDQGIMVETLAGVSSTFKLVPVSCVSTRFSQLRSPHFIRIHFTCISRWMGGSCMGVGGGN